MQLLPQVKEVLGLIEKKRIREKDGRFVVEGEHLALEAGENIDYILYSSELPAVKILKAKGIPAYKVSKRDFELLTSVETPQGILAVARKPEHLIGDVLSASDPLIVYCIGIQDPGNLGTIIRSADAAAASAVLLSKGTVELYNQKVIRSTMGSLFHLPVIEFGEAEKGVKELKARGIKLIAADLSGKSNYWQAKLSGPVAILIGNEGAGLPPEILSMCDEVVKIPMPGKSESLNAAMSATLILYEALRQRTYG
ncbi:MAG: RNA methyltransferase [Candidatus Margulisiibacteriota bacterium]